MNDSARWCATCQAWGDHHTDRHPEPRSKPRCSCPQKAHDLHRYDCRWAKA